MTVDAPALGADQLVAEVGGYTDPMDRYRDFRAVFSTDQGRKVMAEILRMGLSGRSSAEKSNFDTNQTFYYEGQRHLSHEIFKVFNREPKPLPTIANSKPAKE